MWFLVLPFIAFFCPWAIVFVFVLFGTLKLGERVCLHGHGQQTKPAVAPAAPMPDAILIALVILLALLAVGFCYVVWVDWIPH